MIFKHMLVIGTLAIAAAQSPSKAILTNPDTAAWTHDKGDPAGSESVMLREDPISGGMELMVRFPSGHVISPHWHDSNERIIVLEGQLSVRRDEGNTMLNAGGFAFLPARETQRLSCSSRTRCAFYLSWDGNPKSHAVP